MILDVPFNLPMYVVFQNKFVIEFTLMVLDCIFMYIRFQPA